MRIKVEAGPLSATLREIARQTGADLLFDPNRMAGLRASRIDTRATTMAALQLAVSNAGFDVRRLSSGALLVEPLTAPPMEQQDVAVSELLIVGRRTQNVDIRREENDVQNYRVTTSDEVLGAHVDTLGQYFDTRVPANANAFPGGVGLGASYSRLDLRGLGTDQTLVMVDGRRMPSFLATELQNAFGFQQPDISALPLHMIDRVEALTSTAGGIYGFGALGGVVNVVLRRDRPGAEVHLTTGLSSRGDAARSVLEARLEFSPDEGATTIMLNGGLSRSQSLRAGQRGYLERDRRETLRVDRSEFLTLAFPFGNSVAAYSAYDGDLVLKPSYGGAPLGAAYTLLPAGFAGTPSDLAAALTHHAGQLDLGLSKGEAESGLVPTPQFGSLLMNVRRRFGAGVEGYFDGMMLSNRQRYISRASSGADYLSSSSPYNPFEQGILVYYPIENTQREQTTRFESSRFTVGLLAPLPYAWRSTAELVWGSARFRQDGRMNSAYPYLLDVQPFGDWKALQQTLVDGQTFGAFDVVARTRFREMSLRLAGPLLERALGRSTLTLLAEHRREAVPAFSVKGTGDLEPQGWDTMRWSTTTSSLYAELRSTPFSNRSSRLLGSIEVQLAARHDWQANSFSSPPTDFAAPRVRVVLAGTSYTAGAKLSPTRWLMLRTSYATGQAPPPLAQLVSLRSDLYFSPDDPKRIGASNGNVIEQTYGGSPNLKTIRASTAAVGFVVTSSRLEGLRFSLDYARIRRTNEVQYLSYFTVLEHEDNWPERVRREPLTEEDRALGYTGGKITAIDNSAINGARRDVQTLDARVTWTFDLPRGVLRLHGEGAYNLKNKRANLYEASVDINGYRDGPLVWRANGGAEWLLGSLTLGANLQYYPSYRIGYSISPGPDIWTRLQGSERISDQAYLDLRLQKRFQSASGPLRDMKLDFGVSNVLDTAPPRLIVVANLGAGYSPYGDPRQRRFELVLSASF